MATPTTINIDPDGDLFLDAAQEPFGQRKRFRVCSHSLRRQSPVWKQMLFGPWTESKSAESKNAKEWIVELPDDAARPLELILSIIHSKFDPVPASPSLETIHQVLVMANKYDVTSIAKPWCTNWVEGASRSKLAARDVVRSLYVAWELGNEHLFALRLEEISLQTTLGSSGYLVYAGEIVLQDEDHLGPQAALDTVSQIRVALLEKLIAPLHEALDARMNEERPFCTVVAYYDQVQAKVCDAASIGGIYRGMTKALGGMPSRSATNTRCSVVDLASSLFSTMAKVSSTHQASFGNLPCSLRAKFHSLSNDIHNSIPTIVAGFLKPEYKEYMAKQRKKTGLVLPNQEVMLARHHIMLKGSRYWKVY